MTDIATILENHIGGLPEKDRDFARDLIRKSRTGYLSEKQFLWLNKLAAQAQGKDDRTRVKLGDFGRIVQLFQTAAAVLEHPAILLRLGGKTLRLTVAGPTARAPGTINVADKAKFNEGKWYGRITKEGDFQISPRETPPPGLIDLLKAFADNPEEVAAAYGKQTGSCCFCARTLTDERSTHVGYGPICADRFGLAWGHTHEEAA